MIFSALRMESSAALHLLPDRDCRHRFTMSATPCCVEDNSKTPPAMFVGVAGQCSGGPHHRAAAEQDGLRQPEKIGLAPRGQCSTIVPAPASAALGAMQRSLRRRCPRAGAPHADGADAGHSTRPRFGCRRSRSGSVRNLHGLFAVQMLLSSLQIDIQSLRGV